MAKESIKMIAHRGYKVGQHSGRTVAVFSPYGNCVHYRETYRPLNEEELRAIVDEYIENTENFLKGKNRR